MRRDEDVRRTSRVTSRMTSRATSRVTLRREQVGDCTVIHLPRPSRAAAWLRRLARRILP